MSLIVEPWSENHVAGHKMVWVRYYGLPFSLWNEDCFAKVVGEISVGFNSAKVQEGG